MAEKKFNFVTDVYPLLQVGQLWPMKSGSMMMVREILSCPSIRGTIEGGFCQGSMFSWNADGTCNNGDYQFQLKTPEERERMNRPKEETYCESWNDDS